MNRKIKLLILILLSLSVYFIYEKNHNAKYSITSIGDKLSLGINSYGSKDYSYINYYQDYLKKTKEHVSINNAYSKENQTIKEVLLLLKETPELKRVLYDTNCLIITLGYNDLLERQSLEEDKTQIDQVIEDILVDYKELIKEIRKYYKEDIIVIGYYTSPLEDYYLIEGIKRLNKGLKEENVIYIDTDSILKNKQKYFSNPKSYYPNYLGYERISSQIIRKTLEKT